MTSKSRAMITSTAPNPSRKVLLLTSYDHDDVGGRAVLAGMCESLRSADPDVRITVVSASAQAGELPGVVQVIPRGAGGLLQLLAAARRHDVVVVDDGGCRLGDAIGNGNGNGNDTANGNAHGNWLHHARLRILRLLNDNLRIQPLGAGPAPDPAFALSPAGPADADRVLRGLGVDPHRPIIGVVMRGLDERRGGSRWERLRRPVLHDAARDVELARVLDQVALAVETLATQLDAAVVLLPTSNRGSDSDSGYCYQLAAMLKLDCVKVAQLHDPRLYKAVCGQLELVISARVHPVVLAAGMGVPAVALASGGEFDRHFDVLDVPRRVISLEDLRDGTQADRLVALGEEAMNARDDLLERCERLRGRLARNAAVLLEPPPPTEVLRPVSSRPTIPAAAGGNAGTSGRGSPACAAARARSGRPG
jgi:polysaccharide pyruvyl transferase WcaK-like protein